MRAPAGSRRLGTHNTRKAPAVKFASVFITAPSGITPSRCRRSPSPVLTHSTQIDSAQPSSISQLIADVLNQEGAKSKQDGAALLEALDNIGAGVTTTVTRSWEGSDAWLELTGTWPRGSEARRLAMLAVYQERVWLRNKQITKIFELVSWHRQGLLAPEVIGRVRDSIARNKMNGALEAVWIPELLLLCVALLPLSDIEAALQRGAQAAKAELTAAPSFVATPLRLANLELEVSRITGAWAYRLQLAVLRLHHLPHIISTGKALRLLRERRSSTQTGEQEGSRLSALWDSKGSEGGTDSSTRDAPSELYEQSYLRGQMEVVARRPGTTGPPPGRMGIISFGRGPAPLSSSNSDDFTSQGRSTSRTGATWGASDTERGALVRGEGAVGSAGFGAEIRNEFQRAQAAMKASEAQIRSTTSFLPGIALAAERCMAASLFDLLCSWADDHPDLAPLDPLKPECTHTTSIASVDPEQATRRMLLSVAPGPELEWMREQAHRQGPHLLDPFDPYIGNPFQGKQEWDYCVAAPAVWNRYVYLPSEGTNAKLTLFWRPPKPLTKATTPRSAESGLLPTPQQSSIDGAPGSGASNQASNQGDSSGNNSPQAVATTGDSGVLSSPAEGAAGSNSSSDSSKQGQGTPAAPEQPLLQAATSPSTAPSGSSTTGSPQAVQVQSAVQQGEIKVEMSMSSQDMLSFLLTLLDLLPAVALATASRAASGGYLPLPTAPLQRQSGSSSDAEQHSTSSESTSHPGAGAWVGSSVLQVRYNPLPGSRSSSTKGAKDQGGFTGGVGEDQAETSLEIRWREPLPAAVQASSSNSSSTSMVGAGETSSNVVAGGSSSSTIGRVTSTSSTSNSSTLQYGPWQGPRRLRESHIRSLLSIYDDVSSRFPDVLPAAPLASQPRSHLLAQSGARSQLQLQDGTTGNGLRSAGGALQAVGRTLWGVAKVALFAAAAVMVVPAALGQGARERQGQAAGGAGAPAAAVAAASATPVGSSVRATAVSHTGAGVVVEDEDSSPQIMAETGSATSQPLQQSTPSASLSGLQPVSLAEVGEAGMAELCDSVRVSLQGQLWLPVSHDVALSQGWLKSEQTLEAASRKPGFVWPLDPAVLEYQVILDRQTKQVVGVTPLTSLSGHWYSQLPLVGQLRSTAFQKEQSKYLTSCQPGAQKPAAWPVQPFNATPENARYISPATSSSIKSSKGRDESEGSSSSFAVLYLRLNQQLDKAQPLSSSTSKATTSQGAPLLQRVTPMEVVVEPWTDSHSLRQWQLAAGEEQEQEQQLEGQQQVPESRTAQLQQ